MRSRARHASRAFRRGTIFLGRVFVFLLFAVGLQTDQTLCYAALVFEEFFLLHRILAQMLRARRFSPCFAINLLEPTRYEQEARDASRAEYKNQEKEDRKTAYRGLRAKAVLVRDRSYEIPGGVRVTVGTLAQARQVLDELERIW